LSQAERYYAGAPNKLDRGAEIAKLGTTPTRTTVAKVDPGLAAAPPKSSEMVATAAFAPSVAEQPAPIAKQAPAWIGASPAPPVQESTAAPADAAATETESDNPFLAPAATSPPVTDSGWTPTVH
ncbi:MAG TPA: hypothetical protein VM510_07565, partial [Caulifigura sp.]|nr:hypothetical protein [Caulifigura sp.]